MKTTLLSILTLALTLVAPATAQAAVRQPPGCGWFVSPTNNICRRLLHEGHIWHRTSYPGGRDCWRLADRTYFITWCGHLDAG